MSATSSIDVSVVIPVYDDYDELEITLRALESQAFPESRYEVVVADNGTPLSERRDVEAAYDRVVQVEEPKQGSYAARNTGIEAASGDILAFTDADCRPDEFWLESGVNRLKSDSQIGLVGGALQITVEQDSERTPAETWELRRGFPQQHYIEDLNFAATANMFTRREVFRQVGLFNESLMSGGDREWGERVASTGSRLVYEPNALVRHPARRSMMDLLKKHVRTTRGDYQRRNRNGELTTLARIWGITEAGLELAISPARFAWTAATAGGELETRLQFALADTLVDATRSAVAIEQLANQLIGPTSEWS